MIEIEDDQQNIKVFKGISGNPNEDQDSEEDEH